MEVEEEAVHLKKARLPDSRLKMAEKFHTSFIPFRFQNHKKKNKKTYKENTLKTVFHVSGQDVNRKQHV